MSDLTTDSMPLGLGRAKDGAGGNAAPPPQPRLRQVPQVVNISNSKDVIIGPVFHQPPPRPRPPPDPRFTPTRRQVEALLRCEREVSERDKAAVVEHMGGSWTSVGRAMGFSAGQLDNISADFPRSADRAFELLQRWHDREAERATLSALTKYLLDVRVLAAVKQLNP
ncbi:uncharacterized protein LOC126986656 [Eriocheir sinensis]|uniref:uncharacterized protein LOC126986656 n=1 Tax=Eriocheir sinensis TaxID=95602 RepID=UPI0021C7F74D|nr:uncharacterized protein LOC126986656 [Eriocheir sinensis]